MSFVTKKEFEDAIATLERALKYAQVVHGMDSNHSMDRIYFSSGPQDNYYLHQLCFVSPVQAAKNKLFNVNNDIKKQKEQADTNQRSLEKLELEAKELRDMMAKLKE